MHPGFIIVSTIVPVIFKDTLVPLHEIHGYNTVINSRMQDNIEHSHMHRFYLLGDCKVSQALNDYAVMSSSPKI